MHALFINHVITIYDFDFRVYLLTSSYIFAIYYVLKSIVIYTKARMKYLKSLSDVSEIVKDEPIIKEAKKRKNKEELFDRVEKMKIKQERKKNTETKKTWYVAKETDGTAGFSLKDEEASLTFIPKEGSDDAAFTKKTWYVKLEGYALTNLSKKVNYVRHIGAGTTSTIDENNAFGTLNGGNYLLTPYWAEKNAVTFNEETGAFEGSPATTTWFYNDLAAVSTESEAITPAAQTPYSIDWTKLNYFKVLPTTADGEQDVTGSGSQHGSPLEGIGNFMDYCFENSTVDTKQVHGLSTGIAFLGRIYQNEECTTPIDDLYMYAEHNFESINDIVEAYNGNVSMAITDLAKKETDGTPISYEELKAANITKYQGNVCYYYTTNIKHYDDQQADVSGIMEFAVMRNNIYSLSVTNINKIGDPFIDATPGVVNESKQTYLDVMVKIVPWIVRYNDIEF